MNRAPSPDSEALNMVKQAVADYIATLPPAARAATELYYRGVLPRVHVTPAVELEEVPEASDIPAPTPGAKP